MKLILWLLVLVAVCPGSLKAQKHKDIQDQIMDLAPTASDSVIPISYWIDHTGSQKDFSVMSGVVGTGFFVDDKGDFITAAHVANLKQIGSPDHPVNVYLTAVIRQKSGDSMGARFNIVEVDEDHDIALCHIDNFHVYTLADSPSQKIPHTLKIEHPFASLEVAKTPPTIGKFVLVSGFPLGSWTPAIQLGLISAVQTIYPPETPSGAVRKDRGQLLQISVSANHGNSGGPVIDSASGEVVGVILALVPAPLAFQGQQLYDAGTFAMSGLMLAAPASWVEALLSRHNIKSHATRAGRLVIW
jgi:S1-C subfamily serine protease